MKSGMELMEDHAKALTEQRDALAAELAAIGRHSIKEQARIAQLETALRGLYDDNVDYLTLNHLGGVDNHWMIRAREVLGFTQETGAKDG